MARKDKKKSKKNNVNLMDVLGGSFLIKEQFAKQFPFMVYVTVLLMLLINNTYTAEKRNREIAAAAKELNDLTVEYVQLKSSIMQASKQSVLAKHLNGIGLKDPMEPLKRINVEENQAEE
jgi:hypothetical protein